MTETTIGYTKKLCVLPFDHRSFFEGLLHLTEPLNDEQKSLLSDYKKIIYEGYQESLNQGLSKEDTAILVDDDFGLDILLDAKSKGITTLQSTEVSGIDHFEFDHGADWQAWIEKVQPTFTKVLLRYNIDGDRSANNKSLANLKLLSDFSHEKGYKFLIEMLVPATEAQLASVGGDKSKYDHEMRPDLTVRAITEMQNFGIECDVWKIEGMYTEEAYQKVVAAAQANGRTNVGIVSLGRNEPDNIVETWLRVGSHVPGVIGFAVGRTVFLDSLMKFRSGEYTREQAAANIAARFIHFYNVFTGR